MTVDQRQFEQGVAIRKQLGMHTKPGPNTDADFFAMTAGDLFGGVFTRPGLNLRDRELITTAVIIAIGGSHENLSNHLRALRAIGFADAQIQEIIVQTMYYCGWPRGAAANQIYNKVKADGPPPAPVSETPPGGIAPEGAAARRLAGEKLGRDLGLAGKPAGVDDAFQALTVTELLGGVFSRPNLALRDRVMISLAAMIVVGGVEYLGDHFRAAAAVGFSDAEIREIIVQTMYYCGWPRGAAANQVYNRMVKNGHG